MFCNYVDFFIIYILGFINMMAYSNTLRGFLKMSAVADWRCSPGLCFRSIIIVDLSLITERNWRDFWMTSTLKMRLFISTSQKKELLYFSRTDPSSFPCL